jgi:hypothetical protein
MYFVQNICTYFSYISMHLVVSAIIDTPAVPGNKLLYECVEEVFRL